MYEVNYTAFITIFSNWFSGNYWKILPKHRRIEMKFFHPNFPVGFKGQIEARTNRTFCYAVKEKLNLNFIIKKQHT